MTAAVRANLWMCATTAERDALGTSVGLRLGDVAMVQGQGLYRNLTVLPASSTWQVLAGLPVQGVWALGGRNMAAGPGLASVYARSGFGFHTPLSPSSVSISVTANSGWATAPTVAFFNANGFVLEGTSDAVATGTNVWAYGTFTANP